jgi:hypothetical protein
LTLCNEKLLTVIENVFTYNGKLGHEIIFLYSGDLAEKEAYESHSLPILDKEHSFAEWISIADIIAGKVVVFPEGITKYL